jgi:hypothetical protein
MTFGKYIIEPALHAQQNAAQDGEAMPVLRVVATCAVDRPEGADRASAAVMS